MVSVTNDRTESTNRSFYTSERHSSIDRKIKFSSYRYDKILQKWLWFHIEGSTAYISPYCHGNSGFVMSTSVVGLWICMKNEWVLNNAASSFDAAWVAAQCRLSIDSSYNQKAYVAFTDK